MPIVFYNFNIKAIKTVILVIMDKISKTSLHVNYHVGGEHVGWMGNRCVNISYKSSIRAVRNSVFVIMA